MKHIFAIFCMLLLRLMASRIAQAQDALPPVPITPEALRLISSQKNPATGGDATPFTLVPAAIVTTSTALVTWSQPWTGTHVINANITQQHINRRLFADETAVEVEAVYMNANPEDDFGFFLDRYWGRIIYSQKAGDGYVRSYGAGNPGQLDLSGVYGLTCDAWGNMFAADGNHRAVHRLWFYPHTITHVGSITSPEFVHPSDVSIALHAAGQPDQSINRLWVVDDFAGKLFELDLYGNILRTVTHYTRGTTTYRLARPGKLVATESFYSGAPYIAFIDRERNAFVVADANSITGNTIAASQATQFTQSGSLLIAVGQDIAGEWWATDAGLGMLHKFDKFGNYLASVSGFNSPVGITKAPWYFDASGTIARCQYIQVSEPWSNTTGLRCFLPGADALNLAVTENGQYFDFSFLLTNFCWLDAHIVYAGDNSVEMTLAQAQPTQPGMVSYHIAKSSLPVGNYQLRVRVKPYFQYTGTYEGKAGFRHRSPVISSFTQNPSPIRRGDTGRMYCNLSQGGGQLYDRYDWTASFAPPGVFVTIPGPTYNYITISYQYARPTTLTEAIARWNASLLNPTGPSFTVGCTVRNPADTVSGGRTVFLVDEPGGGCPFVYSWNGEAFVTDNNILPQSEDPGNAGLDVTDYYQLFRKPVLDDGKYKLAIAEYEREHSSIDQVRLLLIDHSPGMFVTVDDSGTVVQFTKPSAFLDAHLDSTQVLDQLAKLDNVKVDVARDETMQLWYSVDGSDSEHGLLLVGQAWEDEQKRPSAGIVRVNGAKTNSTFNTFRLRYNPSYAWMLVSTGDTTNLQIDVEWKQNGSVDLTELSAKKTLPYTAHVAELIRADHSVEGDVSGQLRTSDASYAELEPSEWIEVEFDAPPLEPGYDRSFILVTRGRYERMGEGLPLKSAVASTQIFPPAQSQIPATYALSQNYPNPFNPTTVIRYQLPEDNVVTLKLYDILGKEVVVAVDGMKKAGYYEATINMASLASGIYLYRLEAQPTNGSQASSFVATKKLVVVK
jgi:hypothetical protein